jgi:hypothetical protein
MAVWCWIIWKIVYAVNEWEIKELGEKNSNLVATNIARRNHRQPVDHLINSRYCGPNSNAVTKERRVTRAFICVVHLPTLLNWRSLQRESSNILTAIMNR